MKATVQRPIPRVSRAPGVDERLHHPTLLAEGPKQIAHESPFDRDSLLAMPVADSKRSAHPQA